MNHIELDITNYKLTIDGDKYIFDKYLTRDEFLLNDFTHSKILKVAYNDKILDIENYNPLYRYILKENKTHIDNFKQLFILLFSNKECENIIKKYGEIDNDIGISMQNKSANESIKCILNLVDITKNNIIINIELQNKTIIYYRS